MFCLLTRLEHNLQNNMGDMAFVRMYRCVRQGRDHSWSVKDLEKQAALAVETAGFQASTLYPDSITLVQKFLPYITQLIETEDTME